jgi:hypothetical protein
VSVTVTTGGVTSAGTTFTVTQPPPTITSLSPASATAGGAAFPLTINGTYFISGATAKWNGTTALATTFVSATQLTATVPAAQIAASGTDTVTVTTTAGTSAAVPFTVNKATPPITWPTPAAITYGTALSTTQLDATSTVAGTFAYTPAAGTILTGGSHQLSVTFTPTNTSMYTTATATVTLLVNKAAPVITWATPAAITYGTALSATQLNATASVQGTFAYNPASGALLTAGTHQLSATFTPTDLTDYATVTANVNLTVSQATPVITWTTPAAITYGTALSATQLDATASLAGTNVAGTFAYTPAVGTTGLTAGTHSLSVTFTPTDATDYATATANVNLTVNQATPVIAWATPAAITYGTPLSETQLNATSTVPGSFAYSPSLGTVLSVGSQTLSVTLTPSDSIDYTTATATVSLTVNPPEPQLGGRGRRGIYADRKWDQLHADWECELEWNLPDNGLREFDAGDGNCARQHDRVGRLRGHTGKDGGRSIQLGGLHHYGGNSFAHHPEHQFGHSRFRQLRADGQRQQLYAVDNRELERHAAGHHLPERDAAHGHGARQFNRHGGNGQHHGQQWRRHFELPAIHGQRARHHGTRSDQPLRVQQRRRQFARDFRGSYRQHRRGAGSDDGHQRQFQLPECDG